MVVSLTFLVAGFLLDHQSSISRPIVQNITEPPSDGLPGLPPFILLRFDVNGKERTFVLDSGSAGSVLKPEVVGKPPSKRKGEDVKLTFQGKTIATVKPGHANPPAIFAQLPGVSGLLGQDFLSQVTVLVDWNDKEAYFWNSKRVSAKAASEWAMANIHTQGLDKDSKWGLQSMTVDDEGHSMLSGSLDGISTPFVLDTGSAGTFVSESRLAQLHGWVLSKGTAQGYTSVERSWCYLIPKLDLQCLHQDLPTVFSMLDKSGPDAILGLDRICRGQWIIDRRHNLFGYRPYTSQPTLQIETPKFLLTWDASHVYALFRRGDGEPVRGYEEVLSINQKPVRQVLSLPMRVPISLEAFRKLAAQLQELFASSFTLGLVHNGKLAERRLDLAKR